MSFVSNPQLDLAFEYVHNTNKNVFLTGKAGTGKTTFLHKIKEECWKRMVVTAPTGVAAINAGGMTLHSFFQLPFGLHLPGASRDAEKQRRFSRDKIQILRTLDLLVIDEISMVRADLLDAVDDVLRRYRDYALPFGGVQLLMIGDLHQLPPVVKPEDWQLLRPHYDTPYFFGSLALRKTEMVIIELKEIFRQSDLQFIDLLNKVRNRQLDAEVLKTLNNRYIPGFQPAANEGYITLTSHNASAFDINARRLEDLTEPLRTFKARVAGDFPETAYPTGETLEFKKGAQVMFVRNDPSPEKLFFNGKIGRIVRFGNGEIFVRCKDDPHVITVTPLEWQNIKYSIDEETKEIKEEILGTFTQFPLKLAWAITIHKSQGLTFDRAIIDAQAAFAHGQVYVALSRCRSFEGIVLSSKINLSSVKTDSVVQAYSEETGRNTPSEAHLRQSKRDYQEALVRDLFSFGAMKRHLQQLSRLLEEHANALNPEGLSRLKALDARAETEVFSIAGRFQPQLQTYLSQPALPEENDDLRQRLQRASAYFLPKLESEPLSEIDNLDFVTEDKAVLKAASQYLQNLQKEILLKRSCFMACRDGFSAAGYLRARVHAELDLPRGRKRPSAETQVPRDSPHPELYARLLEWRDAAAEQFNTEAHEVLPIRSLQELVDVMPGNRASLKRIGGIGKGRLNRYGAAILDIIEKYRAEKDVPHTEIQPSKGQTRRISLSLHKSGKTIPEIAAVRNLAVGTVEAHLAHFVATGELDILDFLKQEQTDEISVFFTEKNTASLTEAKLHFGERYTYGQLRMARETLKR
jgi:hypothetical protein